LGAILQTKQLTILGDPASLAKIGFPSVCLVHYHSLNGKGMPKLTGHSFVSFTVQGGGDPVKGMALGHHYEYAFYDLSLADISLPGFRRGIIVVSEKASTSALRQLTSTGHFPFSPHRPLGNLPPF